MTFKEYGDYVQDILDAILELESFTRGLSFRDFEGDKKTVNAVIRSMEIIGEAAKNIPSTIKDKYPDVPWKKMAGMRDKLIHEYFGVDLDIVWDSATKEIPAVKPLIEKILKKMK
ncbi:MAG TPA: DUF86 domain-containing protein [bacterium]